ncbi:MAG: helix-turn-helix domain-containing protein [Acetobacteraceae bacterium]|nr:helix-turn-helix domain-containing protein [Acetobacteraceae bacterium]
MPRRSLEKHFRQFLGCAPAAFLHQERLSRAHQLLRRAPRGIGVTSAAAECGLFHFGRFAVAYKARFGQSPSDTLRYARVVNLGGVMPSVMMIATHRPSLAVLPFESADSCPIEIRDLGEEVAAAVLRTGWVALAPPDGAQYRLQGRVATGGNGVHRIRMTLLDSASRRFIWAAVFDSAVTGGGTIEDWVCRVAAQGAGSAVRDAEIARSTRRVAGGAPAWELGMRALPILMAADPQSHGQAAELLHRAVEIDPRDPVSLALAAWCHGLRAGHHFTRDATAERQAAARFASEAATLPACGALVDTILSAAFMLAHNLDASERHARRALAADAASSWGWGRLAWIHAYRGESATAIECSRIAQTVGLADPLGYLWSIGIAAASFELGRYGEAVLWYRRAFAAQPKAVWINRFLAAALALSGDKDAGRDSLALLNRAMPGLTIDQVRSGLPHTASFLDLVAEGLATAGMRHA